MKTCAACNGEGKVIGDQVDLYVARRRLTKAIVLNILRGFAVLATAPLTMMFLIGMARLGLYLIGAPAVLYVGGNINHPDPHDALGACSVLGAMSGLTFSGILVWAFWFWKPK